MVLRTVLIALLVTSVALGVYVVRDETMAVHEPPDPGSRTELVVAARSRDGEPGQTLREMTVGLVRYCRLEVKTDPVGPAEELGDDRFRFLLQPALGDADRVQLRGCLEDWRLDHFLLDVERLSDVR